MLSLLVAILISMIADKRCVLRPIATTALFLSSFFVSVRRFRFLFQFTNGLTLEDEVCGKSQHHRRPPTKETNSKHRMKI